MNGRPVRPDRLACLAGASRRRERPSMRFLDFFEKICLLNFYISIFQILISAFVKII